MGEAGGRPSCKASNRGRNPVPPGGAATRGGRLGASSLHPRLRQPAEGNPRRRGDEGAGGDGGGRLGGEKEW